MPQKKLRMVRGEYNCKNYSNTETGVTHFKLVADYLDTPITIARFELRNRKRNDNATVPTSSAVWGRMEKPWPYTHGGKVFTFGELREWLHLLGVRMDNLENVAAAVGWPIEAIYG